SGNRTAARTTSPTVACSRVGKNNPPAGELVWYPLRKSCAERYLALRIRTKTLLWLGGSTLPKPGQGAALPNAAVGTVSKFFLRRKEMRKFGGLLTIVVALGAGTAALAHANDDKRAGKTGVLARGQRNQINKQIGFIDLYLSNAMNDAKVLSTLAEAETGKADKALISEAQRDLTNAIDRSLTHVQKLKGMKAEL